MLISGVGGVKGWTAPPTPSTPPRSLLLSQIFVPVRFFWGARPLLSRNSALSDAIPGNWFINEAGLLFLIPYVRVEELTGRWG